MVFGYFGFTHEKRKQKLLVEHFDSVQRGNIVDSLELPKQLQGVANNHNNHKNRGS